MDVGRLVALCGDDCVLLSQGDKPLVGKAAIQASLTENFAKSPTMKVLKYEPEVKDLQNVGDVAYEWGHFSVTQQESPCEQARQLPGAVSAGGETAIGWIVEVRPRDVEHRGAVAPSEVGCSEEQTGEAVRILSYFAILPIAHSTAAGSS